MEIPGWAYLLVGLIVTVVSYYVNSVQSTGKMILFLGIGIILMIVGIIKIVFGSFKQINKDTGRNKSGSANQLNQNQSSQKDTRGFRASTVPGVKYCRNCGQILRMSDNFCARCGNRN